ncbi:Zinc finger CCCH domain-containing protein [Actinidia chinensis var. chinensis]|uniref:Zinc finger CCCH domain-containing protein n=1 Tax=Actinidia chinensis var. chinensis TaxID=1590841 RepID=A0A2R6RSS7_ACTCC|nr:Zinc finger CCCH domain-containing protein [Actinidia chinensis var. chinensis]
MRTRFLSIENSNSAPIQATETLEFLRLSPPHLPPSNSSIYDDLRFFFNDVSSPSPSLEMESFSIDSPLSKFFSTVLPRSIDVETVDFAESSSCSEEDRLYKQRNSSSRHTEEKNEFFNGNEGYGFGLIEFELPELELSLENACFFEEEKIQFFSEVVESDINMAFSRQLELDFKFFISFMIVLFAHGYVMRNPYYKDLESFELHKDIVGLLRDHSEDSGCVPQSPETLSSKITSTSTPFLKQSSSPMILPKREKQIQRETEGFEMGQRFPCVRFCGFFQVFEGESSFLAAVMESSDDVYAVAASLSIDLQLFCSDSSELTDEIILSCIGCATKLTRHNYPKMPESETLAESFLTAFPSINPLSAHAILSSGGILVEFLQWSHQHRIRAIQKYHVPDQSVNLLSILCRYGEWEDSRSAMTD